MKTFTQTTLVLLLGLSLAGCFDSSSDDSPAVLDPGTGTKTPSEVAGSATDGKIYYASNCSTCHAAGVDDATTAFSASDLAQKQDMIATDMSNYDATTQMMTTMSNLPQKRVDDLKAYLANL